MMKNKIVLVFNFALLGLLALYSFVHAQTAVPVPTPNATQSPLSPAGAVFVSVVSCATNEATQLNAPKSTEDRLGSAVVAPLNDLNLAQPDIPAVLT